RDPDGDAAKCEGAGADAVFTPELADVYPRGDQTFVEVERVSRGFCGERRPGHFRGVATVVTKLFALFRPDVAVFGEKDFQQLAVVRALSRDLHLGVEVVGAPIVREPDGLAMSSRNAYLSPEQRARAVGLFEGLQAARARFASGCGEPGPLRAAVSERLMARGLREDYVGLVDPRTLEPVGEVSGSARLLVAAFAGATRLIDNAPLAG
ncbi:MAG TPA: pantoate--beta-alanine ligase, partial [Myxococcaceae bacterium]|nr:pantoate--beta-alanine ligase [Myxococcaceae bacterium]